MLCIVTQMSAQPALNIEVSSPSETITFEGLIKYIESEYDKQFFYNPEWFNDKDSISLPDFDKDINLIINEVFGNHEFSVFFREDNVFISKDLIIESDFAAEFSRNLNLVHEKQIIRNTPFSRVEDVNFTSVNPELEMILFGLPSAKLKDNRFRLSGIILEDEEGLPLIGATIQIAGTTLGTITDPNGAYSFYITAGKYEVIYRAVGKQTTKRRISLFSDGTLNVRLKEDIIAFEEVQVVAKKHDRVNIMMGSDNLDINRMKKSIMMFGEPDVIKGILTLPGVQTATEVSTGFNVRGGNVDQNLMMIDNAPVMNVNHFFGFFSGFNADMIDKAVLHKSGIPSSYGGRISSVFDITSRNGDRTKFKGNGGISPLTSKFTLEGPIIKEKLSFIIGARSTYSNWVLRRLEDPRIRNSAASFSDIHGNLSFDISKYQKLSFTYYASSDYFKFDKIFSNDYSNEIYSLNYENALNEKLSFTTSLTSSEYKFTMTDELIPSLAKNSFYQINQYGFKSNFNYFYNQHLELSYGISGIYYNSIPGITEPFTDESLIIPRHLGKDNAFEGAVFISNKQNITNQISLLYGVRYSGFGLFGPRNVFAYNPEFSKSIQSIMDTLLYPQNELVKDYYGIEPRFFAKFNTGKNSSLKLGYNRIRQYINLIYNTVSPSPTDIWKFSDPHILPQIGDQLSLGFFMDFEGETAEKYSFSIETYYKNVRNILDYKTGSELFTNEHFETEIMSGINKSYGIEFQLIKETGSLSGWASYTFSRSLNKFNSVWPEESINSGSYFPANYDKPHNLKAVVNYDILRRLRVSGNLSYSNGRPITLPQTTFTFGNVSRVQFSDRNGYRLPNYFRLDISATLEGTYNVDKLVHSSFTISVINLTGRLNPNSIFFQNNRFNRYMAHSLSIFGVPVLAITYNFKF